VHDRVSVRGSGTPAHVLFPAVSRVQSQVKRWLAGTMQGAAEPGHLQRYLNDYRRKASKPDCCYTGYSNKWCAPREPATPTLPSAVHDHARHNPLCHPGRGDYPRASPNPTPARSWRAIHR